MRPRCIEALTENGAPAILSPVGSVLAYRERRRGHRRSGTDRLIQDKPDYFDSLLVNRQRHKAKGNTRSIESVSGVPRLFYTDRTRFSTDWETTDVPLAVLPPAFFIKKSAGDKIASGTCSSPRVRILVGAFSPGEADC